MSQGPLVNIFRVELAGVSGGSFWDCRSASKIKDTVRAQGHPELGSAIDEELRAAKQEHPGKLTVEVEMGKAKAPTEGRFRELLDRAVRIAEINAEMNPAA